jgi:gluconolactonase
MAPDLPRTCMLKIAHSWSNTRSCTRDFGIRWFPVLILILAAHVSFALERFVVSEDSSKSTVVLRDSVAGIEATVRLAGGGTLSSFRVMFKDQWIELLQPPQGEAGGAALLLPAGDACGSSLKQFGLAQHIPWTQVGHSADNQGARVTIELRDSGQTRKCYPFGFLLDARFELGGGQLTIDYTVKADPSNIAPMTFSIGDRIFFKVPFVPGSAADAMTFESPSTTQLLRNNKVERRSFASAAQLQSFDTHVATSLAGYQIAQPYALLRDPQGLSLRVTQQTLWSLPEPLVRFRISGGPHAGYFSVAPWFGAVTLQPPMSTLTWRLQLKPAVPPPDTPMSAGVERVASGLGYVEGPVWSKKGFLLFSDMLASRILKMAAANHVETYRDGSNGTNGNALDTQGRLYSCERDGRRVVRREMNGHVTVVASLFEGKRLNDPNDVVVRRDGQVYFSDSRPKGSLQPFELDSAGLYHVNTQGKISLIAKMPAPNGVTLTPDGRTLYVSDTAERTIIAYDLDADGNTSRKRVFVSGIDGGPDGLRVASNGNVYVAARGIAVYSPAGKFLQTIELPETPANCAFGDRDLKTLYVTARTSIYRVRIPDKGFLLY